MKLIYSIFCLVFITTPHAVALKNISPQGAAKLDQIIGVIKSKHEKRISEEQLIENAANGILSSLDPYSYFYNAKSFEELSAYTLGEFCGIGVEIKLKRGNAVVIQSLSKSPAERAGIMPGDKIISIDDVFIVGMSERKIMQNLLGPPNSEVTLGILRGGKKAKLMKFSMTRTKVELASVESNFFQDGVFYLKIGSFYENTAKLVGESCKALKELQEQNKVKGVIIDLRDNVGGLLDQAVKVASFFIKKGKLVSIIPAKQGKPIQYSSASGVFKLNDNIPIIVLINKWTASAAEILAGALKDYKRATIIGEKSFGKGSVQSFIPLEGGDVMSLTTALYKTPSGKFVENVGILPDIEIPAEKYKDSGKIMYKNFHLGQGMLKRTTSILMQNTPKH